MTYAAKGAAMVKAAIKEKMERRMAVFILAKDGSGDEMFNSVFWIAQGSKRRSRCSLMDSNKKNKREDDFILKEKGGKSSELKRPPTKKPLPTHGCSVLFRYR